MRYTGYKVSLLANICTLIQLSSLQQCGYTSIELNSDDGSSQYISLRAIESPRVCNDCVLSDQDATNKQLHTYPNSVAYLPNRGNSNQASSFVFADILQQCGE